MMLRACSQGVGVPSRIRTRPAAGVRNDPEFLALGVPEEAWPASGMVGRVSYTVRGPGGRVLQVQYGRQSPSYYVQKCITGKALPEQRTLNWNRRGGALAAWALAKELSCWV